MKANVWTASFVQPMNVLRHYGRFGLIFFQFQVLLVYLALQKLQNRNEKYKRNLSDVCQSWGNALRFILYTWKHSLEGTVTWKRPKKQQNWRYLNYWQSYWVEKGTKMTGKDHRMSIFKFPGRPCGFKVAKDKKHRKFGRFLQFLALFERFLASSSSETTWLTWKLRNSDSLSPSGHFDTLYNPVPLSIVNWIKNWVHLPQWWKSW